MKQTIEDLAREYYLNEVVNGDICDDKDGWTDCFVSGAAALMQLLLASRLTAEEKEMVRKEYWRAAKDWIDIGDARGYCRTCVALESIFGADFFKEGE